MYNKNYVLELKNIKKTFENENDYNNYIKERLAVNKTEIEAFIFKNSDINIYSDYLRNLKYTFSQNFLNSYQEKLGISNDVYNSQLYSFPLFNHYSVLYSNKELLDRHKKEVPKTWNELIETAQYIMDEEKEEIIGFAGLIPTDETCIDSFSEFTYSFRDNVNDVCPSFSSRNALNALKKIAEIKRKISSDEAFKLSSTELFDYMDKKKVLFSRNWYKNELKDKYYITALPGKKENISASSFYGYRIGVNKYINDNNFKKGAKIILSYMASEEVQMMVPRNYGYFSGLDSIYYNQTFCSEIKDLCNIYKSLQFVNKPLNISDDDYELYSSKVKKYLLKFLYDNESNTIKANETLSKIDNLTTINNVESVSFLGKLLFWVPTITLIVMFTTYTFLYNYKIVKKFLFFKKAYWFSYLLGLGLIVSYMYTNLDTISLLKCQIKTILLTIGFTLTITVQCLKLIGNFPTKTNIVLTIEKNLSIIVSCFVFFDAVISTLFILVPYTNKVYYMEEGKNFIKCQFLSILSKILLGGLLLYKMVIIIIGYIFIYLEWNDIFLKLDIRMMFYSYTVSTILGIAFIVFSFIDIDMDRYYIIKNVIVFSYCILNFIITFLHKFFVPSSFYEKNNISIKYGMFSDSKENNHDNHELADSAKKSNENFNSRFNDVKIKMKNYHNGSLYTQNQQNQNANVVNQN